MKRKVVICLVLIIFSCFLVFIITQFRANSISGVLHLKKGNITKITITDSRDVDHYTTIQKKKDIYSFITLMDSDVIKKENNPQVSFGYGYTVKLYNKEKEVANIIVTNDLLIDGKYYEIVKGEFTLKKIADFQN